MPGVVQVYKNRTSLLIFQEQVKDVLYETDMFDFYPKLLPEFLLIVHKFCILLHCQA